MKTIFVCGPWGSGTSAVAGLMANLGCLSVGPFFESSDPKTTVTFESIAFRKLILQVASEKDVCVRDHDSRSIILQLQALKAMIA